MALSPRLELRQSQSLVMTPQLQQAIKLLQLSNLELAAYVEQELERNPLLEPVEGSDGAAVDAPAAAESASREPEPAPAMDRDTLADADAREALDADYDNVFTGNGQSEAGLGFPQGSAFEGGRGGNLRFQDDEQSLEQTLAGRPSLKQHLMDQLAAAAFDRVDRAIGTYLIGLVDEAGYLTEDTDEVAATLGCNAARVQAVLTRLQGFEPAGICARSLKECLSLQLGERNRLDPAMQAMLEHLPLVARRDLAGLMRLCGVDAEDIHDMLAEIRSLNPKPGLAFQVEILQPVVPDVLVRQDRDGGWLVELNTETLPRVLVNNRYYAKVAVKARNRNEKSWLNECLHSANWLVKSLDQRANTILKVASEIVRQQDRFLTHGVQHLRPLNLRSIAEAISMHESTVSRVTANKYVATPRGIFELKYFFTSAIASSAGGEAHSAEAVRHRIRELILREKPEAVLSDDRIVEILIADGIDIARRTVAKYREAMRIPSSVQRRRGKQPLTA